MSRKGSSADFAQMASLASRIAELENKRSNLEEHLIATRSTRAVSFIADPNDPSPYICPTCAKRIIAAFENTHRASHNLEDSLRSEIQQVVNEIICVNTEIQRVDE